MLAYTYLRTEWLWGLVSLLLTAFSRLSIIDSGYLGRCHWLALLAGVGFFGWWGEQKLPPQDWTDAAAYQK